MFTGKDLRDLIVPLFIEQFLLMFVGIADTFVVSFSSEADVSGVSLVTSFNTVLIFLFSAVFGLWLGWGVIGVAVGMSIDLVFRGAIFLWRLKSQKWTRFQVI